MLNKIFILIAFLFISHNAFALDNLSSRFFYSGDGKISFKSNKNSSVFNGAYRTGDSQYNETALKQIAKVFGCSSNPEIISLRLIEFFDYLQDHFKGGTITITSGYRSPQYNKALRKRGALAGKASLHQYGMAADIRMAGVPSQKIWKYVRELKFGGAGYYHGKNIHLDVGPARWWDETSSKVGTDIADDNKVIILVNNKDIYLSGETITLDFARMTAWPIGVKPEFVLEEVDKVITKKININFSPPHPSPSPLPRLRLRPSTKLRAGSGQAGEREVRENCHIFNDVLAMQNLSWQIPQKQKPGRYRIRACFCEKQWEAQPNEITTPDFVIYAPAKTSL